MRQRLCVILALSIFTACEPGAQERPRSVVRDSVGIRLIDLAPATPDRPTLTLVPDTTWRPAPNREFGELLDVAPLTTGGVALLDRFGARVSVTSSTGDIVAEFGGPGEGPGEFTPMGLSVIVATDSSVYIPDLVQQRLTEYSLEGRLLGTSPFPGDGQGTYAVDWRGHPEGGLALRVLHPGGDQIIHIEGERTDTIHTFHANSEPSNTVLPEVALWDIGRTGLATGTSRAWGIEFSENFGRAPTWISRGDGEPRNVSETDRLHIEGIIREAVSADPLTADAYADLIARTPIASVAPVIAGLVMGGGGEVWVQHARPVEWMGREMLRVGSAGGLGGTEWTVLSYEGHYEKTITLPPGFRITRLTDDWIFGVAADEVGVQRPARIRTPL